MPTNFNQENKNLNFLKSFDLAKGLQFFIPDYGLAKILDEKGNLVSILQVPAAWNALRSNGDALAQGFYDIFVNGQKLYRLKIQ